MATWPKEEITLPNGETGYCVHFSRCTEELTGGTKRTADYCKKHDKPYLVIFTANVPKVVEWPASLGIPDLVLNVAGPRESKAKGIQEATQKFISRLIESVTKGDGHADD